MIVLQSLFFSHRVQFLEFVPGIQDGETPIDGCPDGVPKKLSSGFYIKPARTSSQTQPAMESLREI
jgi:hypothetical protein